MVEAASVWNGQGLGVSSWASSATTQEHESRPAWESRRSEKTGLSNHVLMCGPGPTAPEPRV